jgi:hypothetical protein
MKHACVLEAGELSPSLTSIKSFGDSPSLYSRNAGAKLLIAWKYGVNFV